MIDLFKIYDDYILDLRDENFSKRYEGQDTWYHASGAGLCVRKHYYAQIEGLPSGDKDSNTMRLFRLGDLVHTDMQEALQRYADKNDYEVNIETEILIPKYNVRSFVDAMILKDGALYDIKTCNDFKWQSIFGKYGSKQPPQNYAIQLGTYGLYYREKGVKVNKMALLFYNKNTSRVKEIKVPRSYIDMAERYWIKVQELFKEGLPPVEKGLAPVEDWECNKKYCSYFQACGGGIKGLH
jgi:CRISPR/Cas system-associated exonuclease Cas4 (RecB family)|tara:strand:+ start:696 stop:1412 length:717 start_codon:yes stop_codon:yes gene_type:complete